jgi:hypothetical protein
MAKLTEAQKQEKLETLAEMVGCDDVQSMLEEAAFDSVVPAICTTPGCDAPAICTTPGCDAFFELEPDAEHDLCEECGCESVDSCLILAGLI